MPKHKPKRLASATPATALLKCEKEWFSIWRKTAPLPNKSRRRPHCRYEAGYRHAAKAIDGDYMVGNGAGVRFDRSAVGKPVRPDYLTVDQQRSAFEALLESGNGLTDAVKPRPLSSIAGSRRLAAS